MDISKLKKGNKITFNIGEENIDCVYLGRFDFLYAFDTNYKLLPKVSTVNNTSIVILNTELLNNYGFSLEEVEAVLYHEVGHIISAKQENLSSLDKEKDADNYAATRVGIDTVLSALNKTKALIENESTNEGKREKAIEDINTRYNCLNLTKKYDER